MSKRIDAQEQGKHEKETRELVVTVLATFKCSMMINAENVTVTSSRKELSKRFTVRNMIT